MFNAECVSRLLRRRDHVSGGHPLRRDGTDDDCQGLARGFVGCNLVIDLTDFFGPLLHRDPSPFAGPFTHAQLHDALAAGRSVVDPAALVAAAGTLPQHSWRRINRRLGLEAYLRALTGSSATPARQDARATFDQTLAALPPALGQAQVKAFEGWWQAFADRLTTQFKTRLWPERPLATPAALGALLAGDLDFDTTLVELLAARNAALAACLDGSAAPLPPDRLARTASRLLAAREAGSDLVFDAIEARDVGVVLAGLAAQGSGDTRDRRVRHGPDLDAVLAAWTAQERRMRLCGTDNARLRRLAANLFCYPVPVDFAAWHQLATTAYALGGGR